MGTGLLHSESFYKKEHIKASDEVRNLFKNGKKVSISGAKLFYLENDFDYNRIAFTLSRGYGNAVRRNASKRYSREIYRSLKKYLNTGYDLLLLIYPGNDSFSTRYFQFRSLCEKAGILKT